MVTLALLLGNDSDGADSWGFMFRAGCWVTHDEIGCCLFEEKFGGGRAAR